MEDVDLAVIGAGPAGYHAALRAAEQGLSVLLCEGRQLGGECLNSGCIPSKHLIYAAKLWRQLGAAAEFGIKVGEKNFDFATLLARRDANIDRLRRGLDALIRQRKVVLAPGVAQVDGLHSLTVEGRSYRFRFLFLASGSDPARPAIAGVENADTNRELVGWQSLPASLIVIGAGAIGLEFACFFASFGVEVHVVEAADRILPQMDAHLAEALQKALNHVHFHLHARVEAIEPHAVVVRTGEKRQRLQGERVLLAVGRTPRKQGLEWLFDHQRLEATDRGIVVDEQLRTSLAHVFAIGDVNGRSLLAHAAYRMAEVAVHTVLGAFDRMRYHCVPQVVYTLPEVASCGLDAQQAERRGAVSVSLPLRHNGRFLAEHARAGVEMEHGFVHMHACAQSGQLLGVQMLGGVLRKSLPLCLSC